MNNVTRSLSILAAILLFCLATQTLAEELATCATCHGANMGGNRSLGAPNLTGLGEDYLQRQLANYQTGLRGNHSDDSGGQQMVAIAKGLSASQIQQLVSTIASLPVVNTATTITGNTDKGASYYYSICGACHGPKAEGNKRLQAPALAQQNDWYLVQQIKHFKAGIRGDNPGNQLGQQMVMMAKILPHEQAIMDVTYYIRSLSTASE